MLEVYYNSETRTVSLPYDFNQEIENLPIDTEIIIFEENVLKSQYSRFNQSVDDLPPNLTYLHFGGYFNQPVNNLPSKLTHLTLGYSFDQPINNLPQNLTHLTLGFSFSQQINNLPSSLCVLEILNASMYIRKLRLKVPFGCKIYDWHKNEVIF
jgi:hypothetical protein